MRRLLVLPLLLALASCGTWRGVSTARVQAQAPIETILTQPVSVDPGVLGPFPLDGAFVYEADPVCLDSGVGVVIPNLTTAICMRAKSIEYIRKEVQAGRIIPGPRGRTARTHLTPRGPTAWSSRSRRTSRRSASA